MTARMLVTGLLVFAACTGGEPPPETENAADPSEAEAVEEQQAVSDPEPGRDSAAAGGQAQAERGAGEAAPPSAEPGGERSGTEPPTGAPQSGRGAAQSGQVPAGQDTAEGEISVTGTAIDSRPVLQTADGALGLTGELTAELRRLSGARVRVEGERRSGRLPSESIDVSSYTVLEVNGERPEVGTITLRDGAPWLATADGATRLIGASDRLAGLNAAKVWVTGRRTDEGIEVGSYGVIRR